MALAMKRDILLNIYDRALAELAKDQTLSNENTRPGDLTITFLITLFVNQHRVSFQTSFRYSNLRDFLNFFLCLWAATWKSLIVYTRALLIFKFQEWSDNRKLFMRMFFASRLRKMAKKSCWADVIWSLIFKKHVLCFLTKNVSTKILWVSNFFSSCSGSTQNYSKTI